MFCRDDDGDEGDDEDDDGDYYDCDEVISGWRRA